LSNPRKNQVTKLPYINQSSLVSHSQSPDVTKLPFLNAEKEAGTQQHEFLP
jgi:hypothetical protein